MILGIVLTLTILLVAGLFTYIQHKRNPPRNFILDILDDINTDFNSFVIHFSNDGTVESVSKRKGHFDVYTITHKTLTITITNKKRITITKQEECLIDDTIHFHLNKKKRVEKDKLSYLSLEEILKNEN